MLFVDASSTLCVCELEATYSLALCVKSCHTVMLVSVDLTRVGHVNLRSCHVCSYSSQPKAQTLVVAMHLIRLADFDVPVDDSSAVARQAPRLHRCLHADDFSTGGEPKRPRLDGAAYTRSPKRSFAPTNIGGNEAVVQEFGSSPLPRNTDRKLHGMSVHLSGLPYANTPAQAQARERAADVVKICLQATWEPSTVARYNSVLAGAVAEAEAFMDVALLPCDTDLKLMLLFAQFDGMPWGSISASKCAVRAWHLERGCSDVFEAVWSERALMFWKGLKKRADHSRRRAKRPIYHSELVGFQRARLEAGTVAGI